MKITSKTTGNSVEIKAELSVTDLEPAVKTVFNRLRPQVEAKGFRPGKAPNEVIEKELGPERIQNEVLEAVAEKAYRQALDQEDIRPITNPQVRVVKFVPYSEAELVFDVETMPVVKLPDYKKMTKDASEPEVEDKEVDQVLESLRQRVAKRKVVKRAAKAGDEATVDFEGFRNGEPVPGASAKDYALILGTDRFVKGFEDAITGMKPEEEKQFTVTFPKDYGEKTLAGNKVDFKVKLKEVAELELPKLDDEFAKSAGPFKDLESLKSDIKEHLLAEKKQNARRQLENEIVAEVVEKSKVELPATMVEREAEQVRADFKRRLSEQGVDEDKYLKEAKKSAKDHEDEINQEAERRVKMALVMSEIANIEKLEIQPEELEVRMQLIAGQYKDDSLQEQLKTPEARREVANQLLMEKTVEKLVEYIAKENKDKAK